MGLYDSFCFSKTRQSRTWNVPFLCFTPKLHAMANLSPEAAIAVLESERLKAQERREAKTRVGLEQALQERAWRNRPISKASRAIFLEGLAAGVPITVICEKLEIARMAFYRARHSDPDFAQAWDDAIEIRAEPLIERLADIGEHGDPASMATVRALEVALKGSVRRFNAAPSSVAASTKVTRNADGSSSFETKLGAFSD